MNLASTKEALGDLRGALALQEQVFAIRSRTLPDDHPDLQLARLNLAGTKNALGDLRGALALEEQVFAVFSQTLPDDHPDLQAARLKPRCHQESARRPAWRARAGGAGVRVSARGRCPTTIRTCRQHA
jgi:tetratricopeptide (TPR) repeat protein